MRVSPVSPGGVYVWCKGRKADGQASYRGAVDYAQPFARFKARRGARFEAAV